MNTISLGEPFELFPLPPLGTDCVIPYPTSDGLYVLIMLANLKDFEVEAIIHKNFVMGMTRTEVVSYLVMNFGCITLDFSLNVLKIKDAIRDMWLSDKTANHVNIFLVRSEDGILVGTRTFNLELLNEFKKISKEQTKYPLQVIDELIKYGESIQSTTELFNCCSKRELIHAPETAL